jgi:hypothetical protein
LNPLCLFNKEAKGIFISIQGSSEPVTQDAIVQIAINNGLEIRIIKPMGSNVPLGTDRIVRE